jgi:hypothetical protein
VVCSPPLPHAHGARYGLHYAVITFVLPRTPTGEVYAQSPLSRGPIGQEPPWGNANFLELRTGEVLGTPLLGRTVNKVTETIYLCIFVHPWLDAKASPRIRYRPKEREKMASRTAPSGGDYDLSDPINSFVDVVRRVVFQPPAFFADIPRQGNLLGPLVFALVCTEISVLLVGLLTFLDVPGGVTWLFGARGNQGFLSFVGGLVIAPIAAAVGLFLTALVTHLLVILVVGSGHSGFGATFRILAYSSVTSLAGWIPFVGGIFALYRLYLAFVGIREMHATTTAKALLVVLLPAILIVVLVVVVGTSAIVFFRPA